MERSRADLECCSSPGWSSTPNASRPSIPEAVLRTPEPAAA
jgi:hypothetical protein